LEAVDIPHYFYGPTAFRILSLLKLSKASLKSIDIGIELDLTRIVSEGLLDDGFSFFRGFSQLEVINLSGEKLPEVIPLIPGRLSSLAISSLPELSKDDLELLSHIQFLSFSEDERQDGPAMLDVLESCSSTLKELWLFDVEAEDRIVSVTALKTMRVRNLGEDNSA